MDISIGFDKLECTGHKKVKFVKLLGQDWKTIELPKDTSIKIIAQYEVDQNYVRSVQF
jgi:hypothetical protein